MNTPLNTSKIGYALIVMDIPPSGNTSFSKAFIEKHPRFIKKIQQNEMYDAMYISQWEKGGVYSSYGNILSSDNPCIVKYGENVWLCESNNDKNRKDQINVSTYAPDEGILLDGYKWKRLFKLDISDKGKYTRIQSHIGLIDAIINNDSSFCTKETNGISGKCSLYSNTSTTGVFIGSFSTDCSTCNTLYKSLRNTDISVKFLINEDNSNITLTSNKEKLENIIKTSPTVRTNFNLKTHAEHALTSGLSAGSIISANIDSSVLYTDMPTNLTIGIVGDGIGAGAAVEFIYTNVVGSTGTISGIKLTENGSGYKSDIKANITGIGGITASSLSDGISFVVPSSTNPISPMSSIFDFRSSFPGQVITLITTSIDPKAESINCNAYALLKNQINDDLPDDITGVKFFTPGDAFASNALNQYYTFSFIIPG